MDVCQASADWFLLSQINLQLSQFKAGPGSAFVHFLLAQLNSNRWIHFISFRSFLFSGGNSIKVSTLDDATLIYRLERSDHSLQRCKWVVTVNPKDPRGTRVHVFTRFLCSNRDANAALQVRSQQEKEDSSSAAHVRGRGSDNPRAFGNAVINVPGNVGGEGSDIITQVLRLSWF